MEMDTLKKVLHIQATLQGLVMAMGKGDNNVLGEALKNCVDLIPIAIEHDQRKEKEAAGQN